MVGAGGVEGNTGVNLEGYGDDPFLRELNMKIWNILKKRFWLYVL
jgi:hypothetical protein